MSPEDNPRPIYEEDVYPNENIVKDFGGQQFEHVENMGRDLLSHDDNYAQDVSPAIEEEAEATSFLLEEERRHAAISVAQNLIPTGNITTVGDLLAAALLVEAYLRDGTPDALAAASPGLAGEGGVDTPA